VGDQNKQQPHREPSFSPLRSFRKSAQQLGLLSELPIRHTQAAKRQSRADLRRDSAMMAREKAAAVALAPLWFGVVAALWESHSPAASELF